MDLVERLCFPKERNATRSTAWNTKLSTSPSTRGSAPPNTTPRQQQQQQQQKQQQQQQKQQQTFMLQYFRKQFHVDYTLIKRKIKFSS
jgi:hypothetical protein